MTLSAPFLGDKNWDTHFIYIILFLQLLNTKHNNIYNLVVCFNLQTLEKLLPRTSNQQDQQNTARDSTKAIQTTL